MLISEMFKNADPRHLAYVGTSTVTYGEFDVYKKENKGT